MRDCRLVNLGHRQNSGCKGSRPRIQKGWLGRCLVSQPAGSASWSRWKTSFFGPSAVATPGLYPVATALVSAILANLLQRPPRHQPKLLPQPSLPPLLYRSPLLQAAQPISFCLLKYRRDRRRWWVLCAQVHKALISSPNSVIYLLAVWAGHIIFSRL